MKKIVLSALITMNLLNASGIPVVDAVANAQAMAQNIKTVAEYAEQAKRWVDTTTHYQSQLKAYSDQLVSQTGVRDSVSFIQDIDDFNKFSKSYSKEFLNTEMDSNSRIDTKAEELSNKYNLYNDCNGSSLSEVEKNLCLNKMKRRTREIIAYRDYSNNIDGIQDNLTLLTNKLATSKDIKESQDINNGIQLQVAQLDLVKSQVELMNEQNKRVDEIEKRQKQQLFRESMKRNDDRRVTPPNFSN